MKITHAYIRWNAGGVPGYTVYVESSDGTYSRAACIEREADAVSKLTAFLRIHQHAAVLSITGRPWSKRKRYAGAMVN